MIKKDMVNKITENKKATTEQVKEILVSQFEEVKVKLQEDVKNGKAKIKLGTNEENGKAGIIIEYKSEEKE